VKAAEKAHALIASRRVSILADRLDAHVRGDSGQTYLVSVWSEGGHIVSECSCPAGSLTHRTCSHALALRSVFNPPYQP
jgi:uncharacterized Zn finger protein